MEPKEQFYPRFGVGCRRTRFSDCGGGTERSEGGEAVAPCTSGACPLAGYPLAMVYSPEQAFENLYEPDEGLTHGTVFIALDMPFLGDGRKC